MSINRGSPSFGQLAQEFGDSDAINKAAYPMPATNMSASCKNGSHWGCNKLDCSCNCGHGIHA